MLLRPPTTITESIAAVGYGDGHVWAMLPEKHEQFRQLVKNRGLAWQYEDRAWCRPTEQLLDSPLHLAAELAHVLLAAGFVVETADEIGQMVVDVSYEPEKRLQVLRYTAQPYEGWFAFRWPRDLDHYRQAYALPGSRYERPNVIVPPEHYEAVLDFAERYGFWISPAAQQIIDAAAERNRAAIIIAVPPLPAHAALSRPQLREDGIDPDLADDDEPL